MLYITCLSFINKMWHQLFSLWQFYLILFHFFHLCHISCSVSTLWKIFLGDQLHQFWTNVQCFRDSHCLHHKGMMWWVTRFLFIFMISVPFLYGLFICVSTFLYVFSLLCYIPIMLKFPGLCLWYIANDTFCSFVCQLYQYFQMC